MIKHKIKKMFSNATVRDEREHYFIFKKGVAIMEFNERYYIWENGLWKRRIDKIERFQQNTEKIENAINETLDRQQQPLFDYDWSSIQNYNPVTNVSQKANNIIKPLPDDFSLFESMFGRFDFIEILYESLIIAIIIVLFGVAIGLLYRWLKLKLIQKGVLKNEN